MPEFNSLSIGTEMKMDAIHPCPPREIYASPQYTEVVTWVNNLYNDPETVDHPCINPPPPSENASDEVWEAWEWRWDNMDSIATYAKDNNLGIFGHSLVFHQSIPGWLNAIHITGTTYVHPIDDAQVAADVELIMKEHIETVMEHYCQPEFLRADGQSVVYAYDVVNEPTGDSQFLFAGIPFIRLNLTDTVPLTTNHYVREAFQHARIVLNDPESQITPQESPCLDKDIQLVYNDKGTQTTQTWADAIYTLAESLTMDLDTNEPLQEPLIDVVGFQMHIAMHPEAQDPDNYLPENFDNIQFEMQRVADLGVEVIVSELDVALRNYPSAPHYCGYHPNDPNKRECSMINPPPEHYFDYPATPEATQNRRSQAWVYQYVVEACRNIPQCTGISFWGLHDENSWLYQFHPHMFNQMPPVIYTVTATPTNTPTPTPNSATDPAPTPTPTRTPTVTVTPSPTLPTSHDPHATNTPTPTPSRTSTPNPRMTPKPAYYAVRTALAAPTYTPTLTATATPTGQPLLPTATGTSGGYPPPVTNTPVSYP